MYIGIVAPLIGAWIEIGDVDDSKPEEPSRTSYRCVD